MSTPLYPHLFELGPFNTDQHCSALKVFCISTFLAAVDLTCKGQFANPASHLILHGNHRAFCSFRFSEIGFHRNRFCSTAGKICQGTSRPLKRWTTRNYFRKLALLTLSLRDALMFSFPRFPRWCSQILLWLRSFPLPWKLFSVTHLLFIIYKKNKD